MTLASAMRDCPWRAEMRQDLYSYHRCGYCTSCTAVPPEPTRSAQDQQRYEMLLAGKVARATDELFCATAATT